MARLDGKVALITGAGTGIGRATARAMAAEGAKVVVAEINAEAGEQTAQIVAQAGGDCIAVATDVTQEDSVRAAIDAASRHYGGLHIVHNNAGGSTPVDSTVSRCRSRNSGVPSASICLARFSAAASVYRQLSPRAADR